MKNSVSSNVEWKEWGQADPLIPLETASVSAAFSAHVFQHLDSLSHASAYFREVARVLAPGGTVMIHLPIHRWPAMPRVFDAAYHLRKGVGDIRAWIERRLIRAGWSHHHFMRGLSYPTEYLFDFLRTCGFEDVEIFVFRTSKENAVHPFVLARRNAGGFPPADRKGNLQCALC
jgi:SAM-dependent methyltransferase